MIITDHPEVDWVATSFHWATTTISWFNSLAPLSVKTVLLKVKCFGKTLISVQPVKAAARERLELLIFPQISNQTDHLACELRRCTPMSGPCWGLLRTFTVNYKQGRKKSSISQEILQLLKRSNTIWCDILSVLKTNVTTSSCNKYIDVKISGVNSMICIYFTFFLFWHKKHHFSHWWWNRMNVFLVAWFALAWAWYWIL